MRPRGFIAAAGALLLAGILASCGAASPAANPGRAAGEGQGVDAPVPGPATDQSSGGGTVLTGVANLEERKIVKTGEITLEVDNVASAVGVVRAMALELAGYVGGSSAGEADQPATLTLRIPAARFDDALDRLHAMDATLVAEATR